MNNLKEIIKQRVLVLDGAMGTQIQNLKLDENVWHGFVGCNEFLNESAKEAVQKIHKSYLKAGADIIKTNTFGAMPWVLDEYGLKDKAYELTYEGVRLAREVCESFHDKPRFTAVSFGPGTKLPSLGSIGFDEMYDGYSICAKAAIAAKADIFLIETAQDSLQIKAALLAIDDAKKEYNVLTPVMVSVTIETNGTMLIGTDIVTAAAILKPFDIFSLGINCGSGPDKVLPHIKALSKVWDRPISIHANAGLPQNRGGYTFYPMGAKEFAKLQSELLNYDGVSLLGGCCGTTPQHILELSKAVEDKTPLPPKGHFKPSITSLYMSKNLRQTSSVFLIGERSNATGSKAFRELLLAKDWDGVLNTAQSQTKNGAHGIDVSVGFAGLDEMENMRKVISMYNTKIPLPLMPDSTSIHTLEEALKNIGGRAIVNSANLEDKEEKFRKVCSLAKRYGAALVCLCIDESGMAKTKERKIAVAKRMRELALMCGLDEGDLVFDMLTFTVGSGDSEYFTAAIETIEAIKEFLALYPKCGSILGISNISFGLDKNAREYLNSVFLHHCVKAGLSMAIVNVSTLIPFHKIKSDELRVCENLLFKPSSEALFAFIKHFSGVETKNSDEEPIELDTKERIKIALKEGDKDKMLKLLFYAKDEFSPEIIVNEILIDAMKEIGELFGKGKMQLPFVLQSAEVMKAGVDFLKPYLPKSSKKETTIIIGTVKGDVHDVGKNLVDIILSNNGYNVINIGIKAEVDDFIRAYKEYNADAIGMSGLLVKSTAIMKENLEELERQGISVPVLLGGAALNRSFVEEFCQPSYSGAVFYCRDAFDGLNAMRMIEKKEFNKPLLKTKKAVEKTLQMADEDDIALPGVNEVLHPPFWGRRVFDVDLELAYRWINQKILFSARWGYSAKNLNAQERKKQEIEVLKPLFSDIKNLIKKEDLFKPIVVYGYYPSISDDTKLYILDKKSDLAKSVNELKKEAVLVFDFPRQRKYPRRSISDFFRSDRVDTAAFTFVSIGKKFGEYGQKLYKDGRFKEYYHLRGVGVELAEALAEIVHKQIRIELGITNDEGDSLNDICIRGYQGCRYSFGYPACPDLSDNRHIFTLLHP
ncbi:MAG: homocysteine S-methyltransferase family protein, partial [Campylobacteraceae bacterium]|nr:homocysteine S-methyltransferase family protein [Campylobacteraceae bacterium]